MSEQAIFSYLHDGWFGQLMVGVPWLFSVFETLHFIGLSVMIGALLAIDLAVLGVLKRIPISRALKLTPYAVIGFAVNLVTGIGFVCFNPQGYWSNPAFKVKMLLVLLAGANAVWFALAQQKRLVVLDAGQRTALSAKIAAGLSLTLWILVIIAGRLLPTFQTTGTG